MPGPIVKKSRTRFRKSRHFYKAYLPKRVYYMGRAIQKLRKVINVEYKTSNDSGTVVPSTSGDIRLLCDVAQGDGKGQRDGMSVKWQHMSMKGFVTKNASANETTVRLILLLDRQPNGALPALNDVLDATGAGEPTLRPMNVDNGYRFKILAQRLISVDANTTRKNFTWYKRLNLHTKYSGTTAAIGDIRTNSIILLSVSSESVNNPVVTYNAQSRYTDN